MTPDSPRPATRPVTYTYTAPSGAIVVVSGVPAEVYEDDEGREDVFYRIDVAERLDGIINAALAVATPHAAHLVSYGDEPTLPAADYTLKWDGPDENVPHPSIQTWRRVIDKTYTAFKIAARAAAAKPSSVPFPSVVYFVRSSIVLGMRTNDQGRLFAFDYGASDEAEKTMRLLIETSEWLDGNAGPPAAIVHDAAAMESVLRAVEELAPVDDKTTVALGRVGDAEATHFTRAKREVARQKRIEIRLQSSHASRPIKITGRIANLDLMRKVTLRDVIPTPEWPYKTASCIFEPDLLPALLENFGQTVVVSGVQDKEPRGWSRRPEILDVTRQPPAPNSRTDLDTSVT